MTNAIQFIQQNGVDKAREVVEGIPSKYMSCYYSTLCYCTKSKKYSDRFKPRESLVNMGWLKRLVESVDYVAIHGYEKSKEILKNAPVGAECYSWSIGNSGVRDKTVELVKLKQAIADYESIYGGEHV